jgi:DNA-binding NtrC family response regulator
LFERVPTGHGENKIWVVDEERGERREMSPTLERESGNVNVRTTLDGRGAVAATL